MEERFFYCETCGNLFFATIASGVIPYCCGEEMTLLNPSTSEGSGEKHLPVIECLEGNKVKIKVGSIPHPMTKEHNIRFICLLTTKEVIMHYLLTEESPEVTLCFQGRPICAYAYCNIHGLWYTDIECPKD